LHELPQDPAEDLSIHRPSIGRQPNRHQTALAERAGATLENEQRISWRERSRHLLPAGEIRHMKNKLGPYWHRAAVEQVHVHLRLNTYEGDGRAWDAARGLSRPHVIGSIGRPAGQNPRRLIGGGDSPLGDADQGDVMNAPLCVVRAWDATTDTMFGA